MAIGGDKIKYQHLYGPNRNADYARIRGQMLKTNIPLADRGQDQGLTRPWDTSARADFVVSNLFFTSFKWSFCPSGVLVSIIQKYGTRAGKPGWGNPEIKILWGNHGRLVLRFDHLYHCSISFTCAAICWFSRDQSTWTPRLNSLLLSTK